MMNIFRLRKDAKYICMTAYYAASAIGATVAAIDASVKLNNTVRKERKKRKEEEKEQLKSKVGFTAE